MAPLDAGRISAHGLGGAKDLPIPSELAIAGAVAALVVSFTVLAVAWREPRYDAATSGRPVGRHHIAVVMRLLLDAEQRFMRFELFRHRRQHVARICCMRRAIWIHHFAHH